LIHTDIWPQEMCRNLRVASLLGEGNWAPSDNVARDEAYPITSGMLIHLAFLPQQAWAENWGLCPFECGCWVPTHCGRGWGLISVPSFILIQDHPTV